jgi:hypothetical protein
MLSTIWGCSKATQTEEKRGGYLNLYFKDDTAPDVLDQILDRANGIREAAFIDTAFPDNRYIVRGYSVIERNDFTGAPESIRVHDVHIDIFFIDPSLQNTSEVKNRERGSVIVFNKFENDNVELLKKSNGYPHAYVYTIHKITGYEQDHVRPAQITELEPLNENKDQVIATTHIINVGELKDADSFGTAPVTTMLDKARLNGSFHPRPDDPVWGDRNCLAYNCPICNQVGHSVRRLQEEGGRLSNTYLLGEPAFSQHSLARDELNYLKRDIMPTLEVLETTMSIASLAATSNMQQLQQRNKRLKARDNNDALEEEDSNNA